MAGHSHAANVAGRKAKSNAIKGKIFTKLGRELAVAVKSGGSDPAVNSKLADAISKCRAANMPNDTIKKSILKASGELNAINYEEIVYEGYGIGGSAVIVKTLTDNKNRTAGDVRHIFDKYGGSMGTTNSVSYMFDKKGVLVIETQKSEDEMTELVLEAEADDLAMFDGGCEIYCSPAEFHRVKEFFEGKNFEFASADVMMIPQTRVTLDGENLQKFQTMLEKFDDNDDIQEVYHNVDLPEVDEE